MSLCVCAGDGVWRKRGEVSAPTMVEASGNVTLALLAGVPDTVDTILFHMVTVVPSMMRALEIFEHLREVRFTACKLDIVALPAQCIKLRVNDCIVAEWSGVTDAVARSNVALYHMYGNQTHDDADDEYLARALPQSRIRDLMLFNRELGGRAQLLMLRAAEKCQIERISFSPATNPYGLGSFPDLRRTLRLVHFGYIGARHDTFKPVLAVRRVLLVLGARKGGAASFARRDGDHACLFRVMKYLTQ